jgi:hypothetical protein
MPAKLEEITATYLRERFRWDDVAIVACWCNGEISDEIAVKVTCDPDELKQEQEYRWLGRWTTHAKYGRQFHAQSFVLKLPHGRTGVISYLRDAGEGLGFGAARAARCWEEYGSDAVLVCRERPGDVVAMLAARKLPITAENMGLIAAKLTEDAALEACTLDLLDVLTGRGFPKATVRECVRAWGNRASQVVRRDPFKLMRFRGCGFKRCDATWLELGLSPTRLKRQALAAWYSIARDTDGHTWFGDLQAVRGVEMSIAGADVKPEKALRLAVRGKALAEIRTDGPSGPVATDGKTRWVAEWKKARNEGELAALVADARREAVCDALVLFRTIVGFDGYRVSTDGAIESCWSNSGGMREYWKEVSLEEIKGGYMRVRLRVALREYVHAQVSHLVLETFVGKRPLDAVCCHRDGNTKNNALRNLRWDSRPANEEDKKLVGTHQTGSKNPAAKLTEEDAIKIRSMYDVGDVSTYQLAKKFGVDRSIIADIVNRKLWRHV